MSTVHTTLPPRGEVIIGYQADDLAMRIAVHAAIETKVGLVLDDSFPIYTDRQRARIGEAMCLVSLIADAYHAHRAVWSFSYGGDHAQSPGWSCWFIQLTTGLPEVPR